MNATKYRVGYFPVDKKYNKGMIDMLLSGSYILDKTLIFSRTSSKGGVKKLGFFTPPLSGIGKNDSERTN